MLVLGLMPGMSLTTYADDPYAGLKNTTTVVHFDGKDWYLIDYDDSTVTLLSKECVAASKYNSNGSSTTYNGSTVESAVNTYFTNSISSAAKKAVSGSGMFLLTTAQANALSENVRKCPEFSGAHSSAWWLCSPGNADNKAAYVYGVRPALKLSLESVTFESESNTFSPPLAFNWSYPDGWHALYKDYSGSTALVQYIKCQALMHKKYYIKMYNYSDCTR